MGIDALSKAAARRFIQWTPGSVRDCVLWQGPGRVTYNTQPVIVNADMEAGTTGWSSFNVSAASLSDGQQYAGTKSIRCTLTAPGPNGIYQNVGGIVGNRYQYSFVGRSSSGPSIILLGLSVNSSQITTSWVARNGDGNWTADNMVRLYGGSGVGDTVDFDSLTLSNLSVASLVPRIGAPLTQATATAMPWVDRATGHVRYQGDFLPWSTAAASKCLHDGSGATIVIACKPFALNATNTLFASCGISAVQIGTILLFDNANNVQIYVGNGTGTWAVNQSVSSSVSINTSYIFTLRIASGTNGVTLRKNGNRILSATASSPSSNVPNNGLTIGADPGVTTRCVDGLIPDCAVYPRVLTDTECLRIERYMYRQAEGQDPSW